jgi:hypothetical protein
MSVAVVFGGTRKERFACPRLAADHMVANSVPRYALGETHIFA